MSELARHLKGHVFLFDAPPSPAYGSRAGIRLLLIFVVLELVIGPRLWLLELMNLPVPPPWIRLPVLLGLVLIMVRFVAGLPLAAIGLRRWRDWTLTEKSYFVQVLVLLNVIAVVLFRDRLAEISVLTSVSYLVWGFYQEVMYRGVLQTELTRRWGAVAAIVISNLLYTFGPLHFYYFERDTPGLFAAVFAIGLFFAVVFARSRNLWIVGVFHGFGDVYFTGLQS